MGVLGAMDQFEVWRCASGAAVLVERDQSRWDLVWGFRRFCRRLSTAREE